MTAPDARHALVPAAAAGRRLDAVLTELFPEYSRSRLSAWIKAGQVTGLGDQRVEIAMLRTPDGHSRLELSRFLEPAVIADHRTAPVNALGYLRVMFAVDDLDETLARVAGHGAELVSTEVIRFEDAYRLCYVRGPEGILLGLAEPLS